MAAWSIGEVELLLGLPASTLRHWERVVPLLAPRRGESGRRLYSEADLRTLLRLKHLVARRGLGLAEASETLMEEAFVAFLPQGRPEDSAGDPSPPPWASPGGVASAGELRARLAEIRGELISLFFESLSCRRALEMKKPAETAAPTRPAIPAGR